jgi:hypothetical protein
MSRRRDGSTLAELLAQNPTLNPPDRLSWVAWREIVGSKIAQRSRPAQLDRQALTIVVSSPAWAQELSLLTTTILDRVRTKLPSVRALRFQVGHLEPPITPPTRNRVVPVAVPAELEDRLAQIEDESLRDLLRETASFSLALPQPPQRR